ncbi:MAG: hypothetical protein JXA69_09280, partial [Phycisphaerae bacterium]|nr:hypothetical protein [Phycisphaerae bacterium]
MAAAGILLAATLALAASEPRPPEPQDGATTQAAAIGTLDRTTIADRRRLVCEFDFHEPDNFDPIPMHWTRHREWGFPTYLKAGFDPTVGHDAPPSFRMDLNGGSIGFHFQQRQIEVLPTSDYVIHAWVRTQGLKRARAFFGAALMDRSGETIPGTLTYSGKVGGPKDAGDWQQLDVRLPGNVRNARFISLSLFLTQPEALGGPQRGTPDSADEIADIHGTAWFDDIRVYRLPRVHLGTGVPGNVFTADDTPALHVLVNDPDGVGLTARLTLRDGDGITQLTRELPIQPVEQAEPDVIALPALRPDIYEAELTVSAEAGVLASRSVRLARMAPRLTESSADVPARGFGVIITNLKDGTAPDQLRLIEQLRVECVKLPVWLLASLRMADPSAATALTEAYLTDLAGRNRELIGWIGPDTQTAQNIREHGSLLDLLSADPEKWRPSLAYAWSLYSGLVHWWQIGDEKDTSIVWDPRLPAAVEAVRQQMTEVIDSPRIAIPANLFHPP